MDATTMEPYGTALRAYFDGEKNAELICRRDDGVEGRIPVSHFFREAETFSEIENAMIGLCKGRVLDVGAGTGIHSLVLQSRELQVTAIDINPLAVEIMAKRGVRDVHCTDVFNFKGGPYDTILLMGHGIGMVETLSGLDRFLLHAVGLLSARGQVLFDSLDVSVTGDPANLAYHEANRRAGRYIGEVRMQMEYRGQFGPYCGWLQVDAKTLGERARRAGWHCEVICDSGNGDFLARLSR